MKPTLYQTFDAIYICADCNQSKLWGYVVAHGVLCYDCRKAATAKLVAENTPKNIRNNLRSYSATITESK